MRPTQLFEYSEKLFAETLLIKTGVRKPVVRTDRERSFDDVQILFCKHPPKEIAVSILIPTHNRPAFLKKAVESVLRQVELDLEIIIVNDGDIPISPEMMSFLPALPFPVTVLKHPKNLGLAATRNTAAHYSHGIWLMTLDDDDELIPGGPARLLDVARSSGCDFVHGDHLRRYFDSEGIPVREEYISRGSDLFELLYYENLITNGTFLIKKDLFERLNGYREDLAVHEDYHLHIRAAKSTKFQFVNHPTFIYNCRSSINRLNLDKRLFWFSTSMLNHALFGYFFPLSGEHARDQKIGEYEHLQRALEEGAEKEIVVSLISRWWNALRASDRRSEITAELEVIRKLCPSIAHDLIKFQ